MPSKANWELFRRLAIVTRRVSALHARLSALAADYNTRVATVRSLPTLALLDEQDYPILARRARERQHETLTKAALPVVRSLMQVRR